MSILLALSVVFLLNQGFKESGKSSKTELEKAAMLRSINNQAFQPGEVLKYRLHYGFVTAGTATLKVEKYGKKIDGREIYHVVGTGKTQGAFNWFFKVNDRYESYIDAKGVFPWMFVRRVDEGGYKINQDYAFFQTENKVKTRKGKTYSVPSNVQDMLSAFYYARTIDFSNAKKGDIFTINSFVDGKVYPLKIKFAGIDTVEVNDVNYRCLKFHPVVQKGRIFKSQDDLTAWITDDANKIPILAKAKILVGSITMNLMSYSGLANPPAIVQ